MPDYAGCQQDRCRKKRSCARFLMKFSKRQNTVAPDPNDCEYFWPKETAPFELDPEKEN